MPIERIQKMTFRQRVYDQLKETIIAADLLPGELINLRILAQKIGVSQMPIREALMQLEAQRIVMINGNKAVYVNKLTPRELEEITWIRLNLEIPAAEKACELRPDSALQSLSTIMDEMQASTDNPKVYLQKNRQLHFGIYELANIPTLLYIIDGLWARVAPYFIIQMTGAEKSGSVSLSLHKKMFQAIAEKDKGAMRAALEEDIQTAKDRIRPLLENPALINK